MLFCYFGFELSLVMICNVMFDLEEFGFVLSLYMLVGCILMLCGYWLFVDMMLMVEVLIDVEVVVC